MPTSSQRSVKHQETTPKMKRTPSSAKSNRFVKLAERHKLLHQSDTSLSSRSNDEKKGEEQTHVMSNSFLRSRSIPNLHMKAVSGKLLDDNEKEVLNKSIKSGSGNNSPIPQFCTPLRNCYRLTNIGKGQDSAGKQKLKSFSCEINLKVSTTPDCYSKVHMETPQNKEKSANVSSFGEVETSNITVGLRVRPLNSREESDPCVTSVLSVHGNEVTVMCDSGTSHIFVYDHCFVSHEPDHQQYAGQDQVFTTMVEPLVDKMFEGYNACLFAYGQTGSGKSYSMMGKDIDAGNGLGKEAGIIPRFCHELFSRISVQYSKEQESLNSTTVEISYFEIYNEKIHDLLGSSLDCGRKAALKVREHPVLGPYVENLSAHGVTSYEDLKGWLKVGNSQRATAATEMNEKSSRSHSIFSVILTQTKNETVLDEPHLYRRRSKINLVDLAGSERISHTGACGDRLREGVSINRSLLTLGKVISALCDNAGNTKKKSFVPYRDSVLTWLLRESLGGSARAAMLATVSPASVHADETLATLRYACQARSVVNSVRVCELPQDRLVRELRAEVERIRALREEFEYQRKLPYHVADAEVSGEISRREEEILKLKEQLRQSQEHLSEADKCWSERLREAQRHKAAELSHLQQQGVAVQLHLRGCEPCLVSLAPDPLLSGALLYRLPPGSVRVGRAGGEPAPDISLSGPLVRDHHCTIDNSSSKLSLSPSGKGQTFVNGQAVEGWTELRHGDRLVIGGNHFFRVNNPQDPLAQTQTAQQPADYQFAWEEIQQVQQARLQEQLEEAKCTALWELEQARKEAQRQLGSQQSQYEQRLQQLGCSLEEQKNAFKEISKKKEQLEIEKSLLEAEIEIHKSRRLLPLEEESFTITPYQSNFLQEVQEILNETFSETETAIRESCVLEDFDHVSLHDMQVMIQEAKQRCKELGINYVFRHHHIVKNGVLQPAVGVKDCINYTVSFWSPTDFKHWLERLRHHDPDDDAVPLLSSNNVRWESCDSDDGDFEDDSITVSTKHIKRQLNESILQLSFDSSTGDTTENREQEDIEDCVLQMERNTQDLLGLCISQNDNVKKILNTIHTNIRQLKAAIGLEGSVSLADSAEVPASAGRVTGQPTMPGAQPGKSNLRSPGSATSTSKVQKNVRFMLTDSQSKMLSE